jgi:hypothetical protein
MNRIAVIAVLTGTAAFSQPSRVPEFEFDVWTRPPSSEVYKLSADPTAQAMLRAVRDEALTTREIAERTGRPEAEAQEKMKAWARWGLAGFSNERWLSNIPLHDAADLREAERIGLPFAQKEAAILTEALPRLRALYRKTAPARTVPWEKVSLIVMGGFLADFCTIDRIPFRPGEQLEQLQPPLREVSGRRWGFTGFEKVRPRFASRPLKFSHNLSQAGTGGLARFHISTEEGRKAPVRPESWAGRSEGRVLFALASGPMDAAGLARAARLTEPALDKVLAGLRAADPPAVEEREGRFHLRIPIFTEADLEMLLPEMDRIAERIVKEVSLPHLAACERRARELGRRFPLPVETYARDKALDLLIEQGLLFRPAANAPAWNEGVWGWQGLFPQHSDLTEGVVADPFPATAISPEERREIAAFEAAREKVLAGQPFEDNSSPWRAFLTRLANHPKRTPEMIRYYTLTRIPPAPSAPKDGELTALFATTAQDEEEALSLVWWNGGWRYVGNSGQPRFWRSGLAPFVRMRLAELEKQAQQKAR